MEEPRTGISLSEALSMFSSGIVSAVTAVFASLFSRTHGASAKPELPVHFYMKGSPGTKCDASRRLPFEVVRQSSAGPLWAPGFAMQTHMCHFFASAGQSLPTRLHVPLFHELSLRAEASVDRLIF